MILTSKTVSLSNSYPTGGSTVFNRVFSVESGTILTFDLSQIVNDKNSNNLGLYKMFFDYGDGNSEFFNLEFNFTDSNYKKPSNITHNYFLTAANSPSKGEAKFFYKNGNTTSIILSVYSSLNNNIDLGLITTVNNSFVSVSADTLLGFIDNDNDFYNNVIRNSIIENLILNIPTVVRSLTSVQFVTTPSSPPYAGTTQNIPFSATDPNNVTSDLYNGFNLYVTQCIDFLLYPDGTITNVEIVPCLPETEITGDADFTEGQNFGGDDGSETDSKTEEEVNEEQEKEEEFLYTVLITDDGNNNIVTTSDDFIIIFD